LNLNDNTILISGGLPIIMVFLYYDYLSIDLNTVDVVKPKKPDNTDKWRHKIFTFIVFLFIARSIFGLTAILLGITLYDVKTDGRLFVSITVTTIILSILGDKILYLWFNASKLGNAIDNKESFFNQSDVKLFIYFGYFVLLFLINYGFKSKSIGFWIGAFATYVAFERFWKHLEERKKQKVPA